MKPISAFTFSCIILGLLFSCSNENLDLPMWKELNIIDNLPVYSYKIENIPSSNGEDMFSVPILINSADELSHVLKQYNETITTEMAVINFEKNSLILVFTASLYEDTTIENTFSIVQENKNSSPYYSYLIVMSDNNSKTTSNPDTQITHLYTGIIIEKLPEETEIKMAFSTK